MAKKFRKVYLVTDSNNVFCESNYTSTEIFRLKSLADQACATNQRKAMEESNMLYNKSKPIPKFKVHTFYLIHEGHFER